MPRVYFTVVISGTAWVSLAFLLLFIHHENRSLMQNIQHAVVADVAFASSGERRFDQGKPLGAGAGHSLIHAHNFAAAADGTNNRGDSNDKDREPEHELDPSLGQLDKDIPRFGPGEDGQPVLLSGEALERSKRSMELHNFNLEVSNKISVERGVTDTRDPRCQDITYQFSKLPTTTVIVTFYNEAWSTLMRTVHSVVNRTPPDVLLEVVLVDDASDDETLLQKINNIPALIRPKVRLVRSTQREGVSRARMRGAREARGEVLVFLDSHCEVNTHWLEPMLELLKQAPTTVATPIVDRIDPQTFAYQDAAPLSRAVFTWGLEHRLVPLTKIELAERRNTLEPVTSPLVSGGLFAVMKSFFERVGGFDTGLTGWGGESLEFSLKTWMCGGSVHVVPCSRVGHVPRQTPPFHTPESLKSALQRNLVRVAETWMGSYKEEFYSAVPEAKDRYYGNISQIQERQVRLNCNNFDWYLSHIAPSLLATASSEKRAWGQIRNQNNDMCLTAAVGGEGKRVYLEPCSNENNKQVYLLTKGHEIRFDNWCLDLSDYRVGMRVTLEECHGMGGTQEWTHPQPGHLRHGESGFCLDTTRGRQRRAHLITNDCNSSPFQDWEFGHYSSRRSQ